MFAAIAHGQSFTFELAPNPLLAGSTSTGTITLTGAQATLTKFTLVNPDPARLRMPATVSITGGAKRATFEVTTALVSEDYNYDIKVEDLTSTRTVTIHVLGDGIQSLTINPTVALGGQPATGTVKLRAAAPVGGWKVNLTSSNPSQVEIPTSLTFPAGSISEMFALTVKQPTKDDSVVITATDDDTKVSVTLPVLLGPTFVQVPMGASGLAYDPIHDHIIVCPGGQDSSTGSGSLVVLDPVTGATEKTIDLPAPAAGGISMSGDDSHLIVGLTNGTVVLLDPVTFETKITAEMPGGATPSQIWPIGKTPESFTVCVDPWTYIFDGAVQRPNKAALGVIQGINPDGTRFVGSDYRYSPNDYTVAQINSMGFYNLVNGYGPVSPDLTEVDGFPVDGVGNVLNPSTAQLLYKVHFLEEPNIQLVGVPHTGIAVAIQWSPDMAIVSNVMGRTTLGTFPLPDTDGGLGTPIYAGPHRIAYPTFGFISDYQIVIVTDSLIP
jgi:hypothetical protein